MEKRYPKLVVAALIKDDRDRVLISQRRADQPMGRMWEFPGGKVEPGESPQQALVREIEEELGAPVEVGEIWEVVYHRYPEFDLLLLVYCCRLLGSARCRQVSQLVWCDPARLGDYPFLPADATLLQQLASQSGVAPLS